MNYILEERIKSN